ncbi:alpha/beta hydrolase [Cytobacillus sp. Hz8]|uniref:alpha/beta hydrolase n=1 Tax=Cytobacillus sp. Hz8 TaxID=3347168 RepID=UPI0035DE99FF
MKKTFNLLKKIILVCIAIVAVMIVAVFIYHQYRLNCESSLIQKKGTLIDFNGKKMNVYNEGKGKDTFVFMSGSGVAAPVYEMKGLYKKFSRSHKIAVVERAGYGYSDVFHDNRNIDTILEQTRQALIKSGNKPPYILLPHSISGLEAIYWAQKYPQEIKSIIALDIGLPNEYAKYKLGIGESLSIRGMNLFAKLGFQRLFPTITYDPEVIKQSFLSDKEKEIFKAISYKQAFNDDMKQELLQNKDNARKSLKLPIPKDTPILFLSAYTDQNEHSKGTIEKNMDYTAFAKKLNKAEVKKVKGKHSLYLYAPDEIYDLANNFIYGKSEL